MPKAPQYLGYSTKPPIIYVELADGADGVFHQSITLNVAPLLAKDANVQSFAKTLGNSAPDSFGLVSEISLVSLLKNLINDIRSLDSGVGKESVMIQTQIAVVHNYNKVEIPSSILTGIGDLQRAGPAMLQAAKAKMEVVFQANKLSPSDPSYVYDKRVEFDKPQEASDWD